VIEEEQRAVVGVVAPPSRVFERAAHTVTSALEEVRTDLAAKRQARDDLNGQIRQLVADEELLRRMARLAASTNGDSDDPG
jgi:hypothetical protein